MASPLIRGSVTTATSGSSSYTCNKPTGVVADDLLLSLQFCDDGIGTITSGWTQLQTIVDGGFDSRIAMKVAGGSEGASYAFTQGAAFGGGGALIIALSGAGAGTPVSALANGVGSGTTVTTPTVTPTGVDDFEVRFAFSIGGSGMTAPAGFTPGASIGIGGMAGGCATRVLTSGAATGTANFTATGGTPSDRYGYTIAVTGIPDASGRRVFVANSAAVHRAANW